MTRFSRKFTLFVILFSLSAISAFSQQSIFAEGYKLFGEKKYEKAAALLRRAVKRDEMKTDARIWNLLGLSYLQISKTKDAQEALENAVKFDPNSAVYRTNLAYVYLNANNYDGALVESAEAIRLDADNAKAYFFRALSFFQKNRLDKAEADVEKAILLAPDSSDAYLLKSKLMLFKFAESPAESTGYAKRAELLKQALDALEACPGTCEISAGGSLKENLQELEIFYKYFSEKSISPDRFSQNDPNFTDVKILSKPRVGYTDLARTNGTQGLIKLAVMFDASGKIEHILVLKGLPHGLSEKAIEAARKIEFEPASENSNPVSTVKIIQYGFTIY